MAHQVPTKAFLNHGHVVFTHLPIPTFLLVHAEPISQRHCQKYTQVEAINCKGLTF